MWIRAFAVLFELRARVLANYTTNIERQLMEQDRIAANKEKNKDKTLSPKASSRS